MTINEIMANLESMSNNLNENIVILNDSGVKDVMIQWKEWIDDLIEKHWKDEDQYRSATMFLHMNERG